MRQVLVIGALALTLPLAGCSSQPAAPPATERVTTDARVAPAQEVVLVQLTGLT